MSGVAQEPVVISFTTTNGTAGATDFTAQSTVSYTIPAGLTSVNIPVTILGDLISEPSETFTGAIAIVNANGQQITIGTGTANGNIADDDVTSVAINNVTVDESTANAVFNVTLTGTVQDDLTVDYTTSDVTALAGSDYTTTTGTLTFASGSTDGSILTISVPILENVISEPTEHLMLP